MGVKDLWNILTPLGDRKPLYELQGKTVAIDLSCWVVDSQNVTDNIAQPKMYIRNLFFRTSNFLLQDIFPVFVLEGTAPVLKHGTIARRNDMRQGREEKKNPKKGGRTRFNNILKECEKMLQLMGVSCIKGEGEAEAMCAYLNADGLVDGCISQDSDCFLYGAKVVYRNFCSSTQGAKATSQGSIDEFNIEKIQKILNIGRNKMIAMALICGCDYDEGLNGIGKEAALKLFKVIEDSEILNRMKRWRTDPLFDRMEIEISNPNICTNCGHNGLMRSHTRLGCSDCGTSQKCNSTYKEKKILISNELAIRKKSLLTENFPNQDLIDEFLIRKGEVPSELELKWKKPKIIQFIDFMEKKLQWEPVYSFAKIFPLMTRWQLLHLTKLPLEERLTTSNVFVPDKIKKTRCRRGVAGYEILWIDKDNILEGLTFTSPGSEKETEDDENPDCLTELSTIEPQELVKTCYPKIVEDFEALKNTKKKKPTRTRQKKINVNEDEPGEKKKIERKRRGKIKPDEVKNNRKILEFVNIEQCNPTLEESFDKLTITPKRKKQNVSLITPVLKKKGPQIDKILEVEQLDSILNGSLEVMFNQLTPEDFKSDVEDSDEMSIIINEIFGSEKQSEPKLKEDNQDEIFIAHEKYFETSMANSDDIILDYENLSMHTENNANISINQQSKSLKKNETYLKSKISEDKCEGFNLETPNKIDLMDISVENQSTPLQDGEKDEFDLFDKTYVPLDVRLREKNTEKTISKSLQKEFEKSRFSLGIDSLLNGTD